MRSPTLTLRRVGFFRAWAAMKEELADFYGQDEDQFDTNEAFWNGEDQYAEVVTMGGQIIGALDRPLTQGRCRGNLGRSSLGESTRS